MRDESQKWSMEMIMFKSKPITLGSAIFNRQVSDKRRAYDESSYRLHECSGSAPRDVSARALHPQLRPGGIADPPGEDALRRSMGARIASTCIRKTPAPSAISRVLAAPEEQPWFDSARKPGLCGGCLQSRPFCLGSRPRRHRAAIYAMLQSEIIEFTLIDPILR